MSYSQRIVAFRREPQIGKTLESRRTVQLRIENGGMAEVKTQYSPNTGNELMKRHRSDGAG